MWGIMAKQTQSTNYDAMNPRERAFALFTACEEARSEALANGVDRDEAHEAALAIWNAWAQPLLEEREKLEAEGKWQVKKSYDPDLGIFDETDQKDETSDFLRRANIDAQSLVFVDKNQSPPNNDKGEEDELQLTGAKSAGIISCEAINLTQFRFPGKTSFNDSYFRSNTAFNHVTFEDNVSFLNAHFEDEVWFGGAYFNGYTLFSNVKFLNYAWFDCVQFKGYVQFNLVSFANKANYTYAQFYSGANFTEISSSDSFSLNKAKFHSIVPYFIQANFREIPRLDDLAFPLPERGNIRMPPCPADTGDEENLTKPQAGKKIAQDDMAAFTMLRKMALSAQDHETEHDAFVGEMRCKWALSENSLERITNRTYDALTDFGWSFAKPLGFWFAAFLLLTFIYWSSAENKNYTAKAPEICTNSHSITDALLLSSHNAMIFATATQSNSIQRAYLCLYGKKGDNPDDIKLPGWTGLIGTLHTLFSAILIFFTLLALRNRFKIK